MLESVTDKRSYARIPCYFPAIFRRMGYPDEPQVCPRIARVEERSEQLHKSLHSHMPEPLANFLLNLDTKLDSIIAHMNRESLSESFKFKLTVLEISGAGMLVQSPDLNVGDYIEIVMFLGNFPPKVASAVGQIVRHSNKSHYGSKTFAMKFTHIRETDREEVIRYVFQEERERVRTAKYK